MNLSGAVINLTSKMSPLAGSSKSARCCHSIQVTKKKKKVPYLFYSVKRADGTNYRILLDQLQLQVTNTLAFYTYLSLFSKSVVHLAFVIFCLCRRAAVHRDSQSSWWMMQQETGRSCCLHPFSALDVLWGSSWMCLLLWAPQGHIWGILYPYYTDVFNREGTDQLYNK